MEEMKNLKSPHDLPSKQAERKDDYLNPCSSAFDPLAALGADSITGQLEVKPLASIKQFEEYHSDPEAFLLRQEQRRQKDEIKQAAKLKSADTVVPAEEVRRKPLKNVLTRMSTIEGPSSCLREWTQKRIKVKVVTRSFRSVRGTCTGFIVAFDKYLNLAMVDVDEVYSSLWRNPDKPKKIRGGSKNREWSDAQYTSNQAMDPDVELLVKRVEAVKVTNSSNIKHRHVNQLFIRGDNVVSISAAVT